MASDPIIAPSKNYTSDFGADADCILMQAHLAEIGSHALQVRHLVCCGLNLFDP